MISKVVRALTRTEVSTMLYALVGLAEIVDRRHVGGLCRR